MLTDKILSVALPRMEAQGATAVHYVKPVAPKQAEGLVAEVYRGLRRDFLVVSPLTLHSPVPEILAAVSCAACETLVAGSVARRLKEALAVGVSESNRCPYCAEVHAVSAGLAAPVADGREAAFRAWGAATRSPGSPELAARPFTSQEAAEAIGTAVAFHYINRMVSVFCEDSALALPKPMRGLRATMWKAAAPWMRRVVSQQPEPGAWLRLLPLQGDPAEVPFLAPDTTVARALAGMHATVEAHAERCVSAPVRTCVEAVLAGWRGEHMPMSKAWVRDAVAAVPESKRASARLALLTALAAHQVDAGDIAAVRAEGSGDAQLIVLTAWASLRAAERVGSWLAPT